MSVDMATIRRGSMRHYRKGMTPYRILTRRHQAIVRLVAEGFTNRAIAERMYIEVSTVKNHLSEIYKAVGTPGPVDGYAPRAWLVAWYFQTVVVGERAA